MIQLSSVAGLLTGLGIQCVLLTLGGCVAGALLGAAGGVVLGWFGARPVLRWGVGEVQPLSCLAVGLLVVGGVVGGLWAGAWGGGTLCIRQAITERYLIEDLTLKALLAVATDGEPSGDPGRDGRAVRELLDGAGGSLLDVLRATEEAMRRESPGAELPEFLKPDTVTRVMAAIERNELFDPEALAAIDARGGFRAVHAGRDEGLASYAGQLLEATEPLRRELLLGLYAATVTNAVASPLATLGGPFLLVVLVAGVSRLLRQPSSGPPPPARRPP